MTRSVEDSTWRSQREIRPGEHENVLLEQLRERDASIGKLVASKYGFTHSQPRSIPYRIARRLLFELRNMAAPALVPLLHAGSTFWARWFGNRRLVVADRLPLGTDISLLLIEVAGGFSQFVERIEASAATHIVLLNSETGLLKSALASLETTLRDPNAVMWFGDGRNPQGHKFVRSKFSRLAQRQQDQIGPLVIVRRDSLLEAIRLFSFEMDLLPLFLSLMLPEESIALIPKPLSVGEQISPLSPPTAASASSMIREIALEQYPDIRVSVMSSYRRDVRYPSKANPLVSVIIPTRGSFNGAKSFVGAAVQSIVSKTVYTRYELVVVADEETPQEVIEDLESLCSGNEVSLRFVRWTGQFNFSKKINLGAVCSSGDVLLFLNDDIEVVTEHWLSSMHSLIGIDGIAYVGALLFFEDATIQHAGHFYKKGAGHQGFHDAFLPDSPTQVWNLDRVVSGVTAACSLIARTDFEEVGGFSEDFPNNYNDVDFSLKVQEAGKKIAVSGASRLYHFESKTRQAQVAREELLKLHRRWFEKLKFDPYFRQ